MDFTGRQLALHLGLKSLVRPHHRAALVRGHQVENAEKRLCLIRLLAPVCSRAAIIPRMLNDLRVVAGVVIGLHVVTRVKSVRPQPSRKPTHVIGNCKARTHLLRGKRSRITARNEARPRGRTNRGTRKRPSVSHALLSKAIYIRSRCELIAITTERRAHILRCDPEDVWSLCSANRRPSHQKNRKKKPLHFDKSFSCILRNFTQPEYPSAP